MKTANTWERNPQDAADDFGWSQWFADPKAYRNIVWDIHAEGLEFYATPRKARSHG